MIVSCGEALVDLVPDAVPGGGPLNVAVAVARLGVPSAFVGRVSTDSYGEMIWAHLETNRVDVSACQRGPEPTARAIVEHTPKLSFRFEGDDTADTCLDEVNLTALGSGPHIVHGGTLGMFRGHTADVLALLVEQFVSQYDGVVSLDPNVRPQIIDSRTRWDHYHQRWLAVASLYRASDEDLDWIWPGRPAEACAAELLTGRPCAVIVTRGAQKTTIYTDSGDVDVPHHPVDVIDTVGAGDTFVASVLESLWELNVAGRPAAMATLSTADWAGIGGRAAAAAAITCSRAGADPPYLDEL